MKINLTLPYPPSLNDLYRTIIKGQRAMPIKSQRYREYELEVAHWHEVNERPRILKPGLVAVHAHVFRPRAIGDLDNTFKALLDVMSGFPYEDDSQIAELHAYRHDDKTRPRVEVVVEEIPFAQQVLL